MREIRMALLEADVNFKVVKGFIARTKERCLEAVSYTHLDVYKRQVRKRSQLPVHTVLVIDATTGQNGLQQAREFNRALRCV